MELILSLLASSAAVAGVVVAIVAHQRAEEAAGRAASAEERAVTAAERAAASGAMIAAIERSIFDGPPWSVAWSGGDTFLVTNNSPLPALAVEVRSIPDSLELHLDASQRQPFDLGPKSAFAFMFAPTYDDPFRRDIVVRWRREEAGPVMEWTHPLPPRPRGS
ncbi:hypothetical protein GCM10009846_03960 [Agrococcus versicolor]|uniref:Uncharacterized protein n=1 Tax=Agrococcus versicolor TaxID=501482 RepID=A0ABP5M9T0_9MICO